MLQANGDRLVKNRGVNLIKRTLWFITLAIAMCPVAHGQSALNKKQEELLTLEKEFAHAIVTSDMDAAGRLLADDWMIIDPDGGIVDKSRFIAVMKSGAVTHEMMESVDIGVRIYGSTAVVTALTTTAPDPTPLRHTPRHGDQRCR